MSATASRVILPPVPRAPRIPSDLAALEALSPIEHTFASWGRLGELHRNSARLVTAEAVTVAPPRRAA
jgi:hypothetical protein